MSQSATRATQNDMITCLETGFAASPIDTATPQENQRVETRHVGAEKRAFRARRPPILTLCSPTVDVFLYEFFQEPQICYLSKTMFGARLPSIFITSDKMPRLPRNLHLVATWRSPANAIRKNTQHDTSKVLRLPRTMTMDTSKVLRLPRKLQRIVWKRCKSIPPATKKRFSTRYKTRLNATKCMPRLPRETKQRNVWNLQKRPLLLQNLP